VEWGKEHWDGKRYAWIAAGSFLLSALIVTGFIWPFKFDQATDPRLGSDFVNQLIAYGIGVATVLALANIWVLDGGQESRRTRTLMVCLALPVALLVWWAGWLRPDHQAQADMFTAFNNYTPLITNGDLLGSPSMESGSSSSALVCANGPEITLNRTSSATSFCAFVTRDNGHASIESGYTHVQPKPKNEVAAIGGVDSFDVGCFAATPRELNLALVLSGKKCGQLVTNLAPEIATRLPYNPSTSVLPSN
jgi:hypothetical protein